MLRTSFPKTYALYWRINIVDNCIDDDPQQEAKEICQATQKTTVQEFLMYMSELEQDNEADRADYQKLAKVYRSEGGQL